MMSRVRTILLVLVCGALALLLQGKFGDLPPVGPFVDPFTGFWQNNRSSDTVPEALRLKGLHEPVRVVWDERRVPHIFACNSHDLFYAQGYCVARDRLWQMDFQARAADGRLSEVVGARTLELDRLHRRIGLNTAAELVRRNTLRDPVAREAVEAFCEGANAWIESLDLRSVPVEFKIFGYQPEKWTVYKSALLFAQFSQNLSFSSTDAALTRVRAALGDSLTSILYPDVLPFADPIVPRGTSWNSIPRPVKQGSRREDSLRDSEGQSVPPADGSAVDTNDLTGGDPVLRGSNNWAIAGTRSASGKPLLCNDPHLGLTLPSIWYEVQLVSPAMNVYGVTSPGVPGVLIGFNRRIAFGETNGGSDVLDWYRITFKDSTLNQYLYAGEWRPTTRRIDTIGVRGRPAVIDTTIVTHHGPVVAKPGERLADPHIPPGCALRWTALDSTNSLDTFLKIDMAGSYDEFVRALAGYDCPVQNFAYADVDNNIAIWHDGKIPLRQKDQGKYLRDGADPGEEWTGWIPRAQLPHVLNPSQGFVSSANQCPVDSTYPYYLGWNYVGFERSSRINERLRQTHRATVQDMMDLQNDITSARAAAVLPALLSLLHGVPSDSTEARALTELTGWHYTYDAGQIAPRIFEVWWGKLQEQVWKTYFRSDS